MPGGSGPLATATTTTTAAAEAGAAATVREAAEAAARVAAEAEAAHEAALLEAHTHLVNVARGENCTESVLENGVSRHSLQPTISFSNLSALHTAARERGKRVAQTDYLATSGSELVFSSNFRTVTVSSTPTEVQEYEHKHKKRRRSDREDQAERIVEARNRLGKAVSNLPASELDVARGVLVNLVNDLRGAYNEVIVQSFALLAKKLQATDANPRVLIAVRLNAGVAVPLALLKRCLGPCWEDGAITIENSVSNVSDADMPLSDEAKASRAFGNLPIMIVTSAPRAVVGGAVGGGAVVGA